MESLIAAVVLAVAVVALTQPLALAAKHQRLDAKRTTADALATQMMERATGMSYEDVLGLDGRRETGAAITAADGEALGDASVEDFELTVEAREVRIPAAGEGPGEGALFCLVTVRVTHPDIADVALSRLVREGGATGGTTTGGSPGGPGNSGNGGDDGDEGGGGNDRGRGNDDDDRGRGRGNDDDRGRGRGNDDRGRGNDDDRGRGRGNDDRGGGWRW